ncbi:MAG: Ig-like domain-containing protein [Gemmatimonadota bacterium]
MRTSSRLAGFRRRLALPPLLVGLMLPLLGGCDDPAGPDVAEVRVAAPAAAVRVGRDLQLTAEVVGAGGELREAARLRWSSSDPSVATVTPAGLVRGVKPGRAGITATAGGKSGTVEVRVTLVASLSIVPPFQPLLAGKTYPLQVQVQDSTGRCLCELPVSWRVSDTLTARIVPGPGISAELRVLRAGSFTLTAEADGATAESTYTAQPGDQVSVNGPGGPFDARFVALGGSRRLVAAIFDADGRVVAARPFRWSSSSPEVVAADADGTIRGVSPGLATVTVSAEGARSTSVRVRVERGYTAAPVPLDGHDLNDRGQVAGSAHVPGEGRRPVLWEDGRTVWAGPVANVFSMAVNDSGLVAGTWTRRTGERRRGFVRQGAGVVEIAPPDTSADLYVTDVNDAGRVVGYWLFQGSPTRGNAFAWEDGRLADLGRFGGDHARVEGINDRGQMVVSVWPQYEAWLVEGGTATRIATGKAELVNDNGDVVVSQGSNVLLRRNGTFTEFPPARHSAYVLRGVNSGGEAVGTHNAGPDFTAFLWKEGRFRNPSDLVLNPLAVAYFSHGTAVNERGQALVRSYAGDFLLTPAP